MLDAGSLPDLSDQSLTISKMMHETSMSGSGSGLPLLVQRTVARTIQLIEIIGKGSYGVVWMGSWRGEKVAVKMFVSREESSWFREVEIYQTAMIRHENILGFIAADNKDNGTWTQLWLITEYCEYGSLFDYLQTCVLDDVTLPKMLYNIASGLSHLHMEIVGLQGKPAIAHCDIKSKNILVRDRGICCIADLGLAVCFDSTKNNMDTTPSRLGTRRYLAPEILNNTFLASSFEAYKYADMYAFSLVIWEVLRRYSSKDGECESAQLPYFDMIPCDPGLQDVKNVIVTQNKRPQILEKWTNNEKLSQYVKAMSECWHQVPNARLSSLRVKKSFSSHK